MINLKNNLSQLILRIKNLLSSQKVFDSELIEKFEIEYVRERKKWLYHKRTMSNAKSRVAKSRVAKSRVVKVS